MKGSILWVKNLIQGSILLSHLWKEVQFLESYWKKSSILRFIKLKFNSLRPIQKKKKVQFFSSYLKKDSIFGWKKAQVFESYSQKKKGSIL